MTGGAIKLRYALNRAGFTLDVDVDLPGKGITGVFGRSGAGKTSLLRLMAGLDTADSAFFELVDRVLDDTTSGVQVAAHDRGIGVVFQEPRLFANLSVEQNLRFGERRSARPGIVDFDELVELLGIASLLDRRTTGLSGGEAQRVAIGRALLSAPRLLLMDEPLSSLDQARRQEILPYLEALHARLPVPMLYVSHQPEEILHLADYLVVMDNGKLTSHGALSELLVQGQVPGLPEAVVLDGVASRNDSEFGLTEVSTTAGGIWVTSVYSPGTRLRLIVRASDVSLSRSAPESSSIQNILPAAISGIHDTDKSTALVSLDANGSTLLSRVTRRAIAELSLEVGNGIFAQVKSAAVRKADGLS